MVLTADTCRKITHLKRFLGARLIIFLKAATVTVSGIVGARNWSLELNSLYINTEISTVKGSSIIFSLSVRVQIVLFAYSISYLKAYYENVHTINIAL